MEKLTILSLILSFTILSFLDASELDARFYPLQNAFESNECKLYPNMLEILQVVKKNLANSDHSLEREFLDNITTNHFLHKRVKSQCQDGDSNSGYICYKKNKLNSGYYK